MRKLVFVIAMACAACLFGSASAQTVRKTYTATPGLELPYQPKTPQDADPAGIVLYYTRDNGVTWVRYARFAEIPAASGNAVSFDAREVCPEEVDGEYGFVSVTVDENGREEAPMGAPSFVVVVDTRKPLVTTALRAGDSFAANDKVDLDWGVEDEHYKYGSVRVEYRLRDDKEWVAIHTGQAPSGQFVWNVPQLTPGGYEISITATDMAGNTGTTGPIPVNILGGASRPPIGALPPEGTAVEARRPDAAAALPPEGVEPPTVDESRAPPVCRVSIAVPARSGRLAYDIEYSRQEDAGSLAFVTLYHTADGGRTWLRYGIDPDGASPFTFVPPGEGAYGLWLVGAGRSGLRDPAPQPGDKPQMILVADNTYPTLALLWPTGGEILRAGVEVDVRWVAEDANFSEGPVSVFYSADGGASWTAVATEAPNSGRHRWTVPGEAASVLLKLVAEDTAGHVTEVVTATPITVEHVSPGVRPTGVRAHAARTLASPSTAASVPASSGRQGTAQDAAAAETCFAHASVLYNQGRLDEACDQLRQAIELAPETAEYHFRLGTVRVRQGAFDKAVAGFKRAVEIEPANSSYRKDLGLALRDSVQALPAAVELEESVRLGVREADIVAAVWQLYDEAGKFDRACRFLQSALEKKLLPEKLVDAAREYIGAHGTGQSTQ